MQIAESMSLAINFLPPKCYVTLMTIAILGSILLKFEPAVSPRIWQIDAGDWRRPCSSLLLGSICVGLQKATGFASRSTRRLDSHFTKRQQISRLPKRSQSYLQAVLRERTRSFFPRGRASAA